MSHLKRKIEIFFTYKGNTNISHVQKRISVEYRFSGRVTVYEEE